MKECLAKHQTTLGIDCRDVLITKIHLALVYIYREKYELVETFLKECLSQEHTILGVDSPDTLDTKL